MNNRILYGFLLGVCCLSGCEKGEDIQAPAENGKVAFAIYSVKGTPVHSAGEMIDAGVFCAYTGTSPWSALNTPGKIFNSRLSRQGGDWSLQGGDVYWEASSLVDKYTFFSYAPYGTTGNGITVNGNTSVPGIPSLTYTVPTVVAAQPDLLAAVPKYDILPSNTPVSLNFAHMLTCVGFQLYGAEEPVASVKISGVSSRGVLSLNGTWQSLDAPGTIEFPAGLNTSGGFVVSGPDITDVMTGNGYLMMIPQTLQPGAKVTVTFTDDSSLDFSLGNEVWTAGQKITYTISTKVITPWAGSTVYWDGTKLTFDDSGEKNRQGFQGVYFLWGSLVAVTPLNSNWPSEVYQQGVSSMIYIPNPNPATNGGWDPGDVSRCGWFYIPLAGWDGNTSGGTSSNPSGGGEATILPSDGNTNYLLTIHDPDRNIGDICKYITDQGWAPGAAEGKKWRMPTRTEMQRLGSITVFRWVAGSAAPLEYPGTTIVTSGRITSYATGRLFFPATGFRQNFNGQSRDAGTNGSYWSGSASGDSSYDLIFYSNYLDVGLSNRRYGMSVRCIRDE